MERKKEKPEITATSRTQELTTIIPVSVLTVGHTLKAKSKQSSNH